MYGIYVYENGLKFTGVVARTEAEAWEYITKTYGCDVGGIRLVNREAFEVKPLKVG